MDKKDKQILFELTKDARVSIKHLAKKIKLSESSIIYRLKNLFDEKIILDTHAIVDYSKLGYQGYRIYFNFQNTTKMVETEIFNWLIKNKLVSIVGKGDLGADVIIQFWLPSNTEFEIFISELKEKYGQYIKDFEPSIYVKTYFFNRNYLVDEKDRNYFSTGNNKKSNFDDLDLKIIDLLSSDARLTKKDIAGKLKFALRTINYRVHKLEKDKIIAGYSININREKLNLEYYKLGFVFSKNVKHTDLLGFAANLDNTVYVDYSLSKFDFEINLEVENYSKIEEVVDTLKNKFLGIRFVWAYKLKQYYKLEFF